MPLLAAPAATHSASLLVPLARPLEILTMDYPPYQYQSGSKHDGIVVRIVKEVFQRMEQPINITTLPWTRSINEIERGKADALFTAYKKPERVLFADYSRVVLMAQKVSLFVRKESSIQFDGDLAKLSGYSFGAVRGFSYGKAFDDAVKNNVLTRIFNTDSISNNIKKMFKNRLDIIVSDKYAAYDAFNKEGVTAQFKELGPPVQNIPSYLVFSKKRKLTAIRDKFDAILAAMIKSGEHDAIIQSYLNK